MDFYKNELEENLNGWKLQSPRKAVKIYSLLRFRYGYDAEAAANLTCNLDVDYGSAATLQDYRNAGAII